MVSSVNLIAEALLRSWVQLPPGPFLLLWENTALNEFVLERLIICFKLTLNNVSS
jgi:hypothetical protein